MNAASYRIAPMCTMIRVLTLVLLVLPIPFVLGSAAGLPLLMAPAILLVALYAWVWLRLRPTHFIVHQDALEVGWCMPVGAGGLGGGFGWLWTERRGIVQMQILT